MILILIGVFVFVFFGLIVAIGSPYVPSRRPDITRAFDELYLLSKKDVLVDLGSGDGVVLRMAAARGAKAIGVELNPLLVLISRLLAKGDRRMSTYLGNLRTFVFPMDTTVVYVFANSKDISALTKRLNIEADRIGHPLKVISYGVSFPELVTIKKIGAHHLHETKALQIKKAQV